MTFDASRPFNLTSFLTRAGLGRRIIELQPKQTFFSQGDPADSVFYIQKGRAKITVISTTGKEATVTLTRSTGLCGRGCARGSGWVAPFLGHSHHRMHCAEYNAGRDDPSDA
jgi:CRP-like cAMP-binding protein